jgi:hypothetical protein
VLVSISQLGRTPPSIANEPLRRESRTAGTSGSVPQQEDWYERLSSRRRALALEDLLDDRPMLLFVLSGTIPLGLSGRGGNTSAALPSPISLLTPPLQEPPAAGLPGRNRGASEPTPSPLGSLQPLSPPMDASTPATALS